MATYSWQLLYLSVGDFSKESKQLPYGMLWCRVVYHNAIGFGFRRFCVRDRGGAKRLYELLLLKTRMPLSSLELDVDFV